MRIALDVMGSDTYPAPDVAGGILANKELGHTVILVGDEKLIEPELKKHGPIPNGIEVVHASDVVTMDDKPSAVGKSKPNSSMHVAMNLIKQGQADAFVTMGNTGAAMAIATLHTLRRIAGVRRPALSAIFPIAGSHVIMLDLGANADSKADWLAQFAVMGKIYAENALGMANPRIGLLSNGEEEGKGNHLIHEANTLIRDLPINYIGNIEPKDIMMGKTDVIIADGFLGNIFLKTFEATGSFLTNIIRDEARTDVLSMLGGLLLKPAFGRVKKRTDTSEVGGAPLLGVNGVVIIGHGRSDAVAVKNAVRQAGYAVKGGVVEAIKQGINSPASSDTGE